MKKIFVILLAAFLSQKSDAQIVQAYGAAKEIDKIPRKGMAISLQLDKKFVEKEWKKKLKEFGGKSGSSKDAIVLEGASIPPVSKNPVKIITVVETGKKGTEVWWALDLGSEYVTEDGSNAAWKQAEKILIDFGLNAYREDINLQIAEAEKAYENSVKSYEKEVKEGENLVSSIDKNAKEKEKLEAALKANADELVKLKTDVETNKKKQEEAKKETEKMKAAVEVVRKKLDQVK